ncbi:MAG: hypothetical protein U0166_05940 [Acidobacteriota bacterium]
MRCAGRLEGEALLDVLSALEYRGYDSSGSSRSTERHVPGAAAAREARGAGRRWSPARSPSLRGRVGHRPHAMGTHGAPNEVNAHPHRDRKDQVFLVHNGIVENHAALKERLGAAGHRFVTETDSR